MPDFKKFDPLEWLVLPIMVPIFLGMLVAAAVIIQR
jgi:hypothetical protein